MKRRSLVLLSLAGLIVVAAWRLGHQPTTPLIAKQAFVKYAAVDVTGAPIQWPSQTFFIIYTRSDSNMGIQVEKFIETARRQNLGILPVITIIRGTEPEIAQFRHETGTNSPIIGDASASSRQLGVSGFPFYLFMVDQSSRIKFSTDYAEPEDLRQLVEMATLGRISYRDVNSGKSLQAGDQFAGFKVIDLRTEQPEIFSAPTGGAVLCFTSRCPDCTLQAEIAEYAAYEAQAISPSSRTLLFSTRFSRADLIRAAKLYGIKAHLLQATDSIPGIEDSLSLQTFVSSEIVLIDLQPGGTVKRIVPWDRIFDRSAKLASSKQ